MSHYETLGVAKDATPEEIKSAFRNLAKKHHPDLGGDEAEFKKINEAYDTLSDPEKKSHYDYTQSGQGHRNFEFHFGTGNNPFEDIFNTFFNDGQRPRQRINRNKNLRIVVPVPFLETLEEHKKVIQVALSNGEENLEIRVPSGVEDGAHMTLQGKGDNAFPDVPRGNLEIVIRIIPHEKFYRDGIDIVTAKSIDCFQAMLGTELELDTPQSKKIMLKVPPGTQSGAVFGVTDMGFTNYRNTKGKLLVRINVSIPKNLTDKQKDLISQAANNP